MKVLCIGDSITAGTGSTRGHSYPKVMQGYLQRFFDNVRIVNDGKPAYSTKDFWEYMRHSYNWAGGTVQGTKSYDAAVIMLGSNDCRRDNWVETGKTIEYLTYIAQYAVRLTGSPEKVFLCSIIPLADPMPPNIIGGDREWAQYRVFDEINPAIESLASSMGLNFIDVHSEFCHGLESGRNLYDGIHPYDEGYELIGTIIGKAVAEAFEGHR